MPYRPGSPVGPKWCQAGCQGREPGGGSGCPSRLGKCIEGPKEATPCQKCTRSVQAGYKKCVGRHVAQSERGNKRRAELLTGLALVHRNVEFAELEAVVPWMTAARGVAFKGGIVDQTVTSPKSTPRSLCSKPEPLQLPIQHSPLTKSRKSTCCRRGQALRRQRSRRRWRHRRSSGCATGS